MNPKLEIIIQELISHESQLKSELNARSIEISKITDRLTQIQSALAALRGKSSTKLTKNGASSARKPVTSDAIAEAIANILKEQKSVPVSELWQHVRSLLLATGHTRTGLKPLFSKVLSSSRFKIDQAQNAALA